MICQCAAKSAARKEIHILTVNSPALDFIACHARCLLRLPSSITFLPLAPGYTSRAIFTKVLLTARAKIYPAVIKAACTIISHALIASKTLHAIFV